MIPTPATLIATLVDGNYSGPNDLVVTGNFKFDSREVKPGDVFLALRGERSDGHDFVTSAMAAGAALAMTTRRVDAPHIQVADVLVAISQLAKHLRSQLPQLKVIGITGSQGKTTTKDILGSILEGVGACVIPTRSFNNDLGVPITLLRCDKETKFCVLEMGARHTGDIARLTELAAPDVGIVLRVGNAHLGEFGSRANIAATKSELIRGLKPGATAILGTYDEFTPEMPVPSAVRRITFGETSSAQVRAADVELHGGHPAFDLVTPEGREPVELQLIGAHQIANALAAAAAAFALGITTHQIAGALSLHTSQSPWRMELVEVDGALLINDSYNANPESMAAALQTLVLLTQERGGRSWAFLGRMHELGESAGELHNQVGSLARSLKVDHLVAIGERGFLARQGSEIGTTEHFYPDVASAVTILPEIQAGDVILVKASRAEHLEQLADQIVLSRESAERGEV